MWSWVCSRMVHSMFVQPSDSGGKGFLGDGVLRAGLFLFSSSCEIRESSWKESSPRSSSSAFDFRFLRRREST